MKYVKVVFTLAAGVYGKNVAAPKHTEESKDFIVFEVGSQRTKVFKESLDVLLKSQVISDNKHHLFQRVAWCEPNQVDRLEKEFLSSAKKRYTEQLNVAQSSLESIKEREDKIDVQ